MKIEVIYACPTRQDIVVVNVPAATTAQQVLFASGLLTLRPEIAGSAALAVYGVRVAADSELKEGDRLEVLRELIMSPMEARRTRANRQQRVAHQATSGQSPVSQS